MSVFRRMHGGHRKLCWVFKAQPGIEGGMLRILTQHSAKTLPIR